MNYSLFSFQSFSLLMLLCLLAGSSTTRAWQQQQPKLKQIAARTIFLRPQTAPKEAAAAATRTLSSRYQERPVLSRRDNTRTVSLSLHRLSMSTDAKTESSSEASSSSSTPASSSSSNHAADSSQVVPFVKPPRVVREDLPVVYVYDHCPFCVRVRLVLGLKNVKHRIHFLANDDVQTPTALVGKKIAPILEWKEANIVMPESMDICQLVDRDERLYHAVDGSGEGGAAPIIKPATDRTDIKEWQASVQSLLRGLQRPRYVATGLLPEFQQLDARHAFVMNHVMPPYKKEEWKSEKMTLSDKLTVYAEAMAKDPAGDIEELNRKLVELDDIIFSEHHCSPTGGISYDDIDLFSRLRSITIIKGIEWPVKLGKYMQRMAELGDMPLYDEMAL